MLIKKLIIVWDQYQEEEKQTMIERYELTEEEINQIKQVKENIGRVLKKQKNFMIINY